MEWKTDDDGGVIGVSNQKSGETKSTPGRGGTVQREKQTMQGMARKTRGLCCVKVGGFATGSPGLPRGQESRAGTSGWAGRCVLQEQP